MGCIWGPGRACYHMQAIKFLRSKGLKATPVISQIWYLNLLAPEIAFLKFDKWIPTSYMKDISSKEFAFGKPLFVVHSDNLT